jgi:hypothetical protein
MPPDNSMQIAQLNAQVQQAALAQRAQSDQARLANQQQLEQARMQERSADRDAELQREAMRQQAENQRSQSEMAARVGMNNSDNQTAMTLAQLEIATGERIGVSTGTGVNPQPR